MNDETFDILIIENNPEVKGMISKAFNIQGINLRIAYAQNLDQASEILKRSNPCLILSEACFSDGFAMDMISQHLEKNLSVALLLGDMQDWNSHEITGSGLKEEPKPLLSNIIENKQIKYVIKSERLWKKLPEICDAMLKVCEIRKKIQVLEAASAENAIANDDNADALHLTKQLLTSEIDLQNMLHACSMMGIIMKQSKGDSEGGIEKLSPSNINSNKQHLDAVQLSEETARLSSLGVMAAGITHEINQPLNAIKVHADTALYLHKLGKTSLPDPIVKIFQGIRDGASRIENIIKHMRSYWDPTATKAHEIFDLNEIIQSALTLTARKALSHSVKIELMLNHEAVMINANSVQVEQIINNLIINSINSLDKVSKDVKIIEIHTFYSDSSVVLQISDNGGGLPVEDMDELFDPLLAARYSAEGTGLGLAVVSMFVKLFHGKIEAKNKEEGGSEFSIFFPRADQKEN